MKTCREDSTAEIDAFENDIYAEVKQIIETIMTAPLPATDLLKMKEYYYKKKYLQRILERLEG